MKAKILSILMVLVISVMAIPSIVSAAGETITLRHKDVAWATTGTAVGTLNYNTSGTNFVYTFSATGLGVVVTNYSLIYFADPYPGTASCRLLGVGTLSTGGTLSISGSPDLGMDLPSAPDANMIVEYNVPPNLTSAKPHGAKVWLVPSSDFSTTVVGAAGTMTAWNPTEILFETDLVLYTDTDKPPTTTGTPLVTVVTTPTASIGLTVSPVTLMNFGSVEIGQCSTAGANLITLHNSGTVPITVTAIPSSGFYATSLKFGGVLATAWSSAKMMPEDTVILDAQVCPLPGLTGTVTGSVAFMATFAP